MADFFNVISPPEAIDLMSKNLSVVGHEVINTEDSFGRILSVQIFSQEESPSFDRSSMDGYSVKASDTYGASDALPAYLELAGEVPMGSAPELTLSPGEAATAYTGGMLASNADAVVMVEHTKISPSGLLEVYRPVAAGENVIVTGEDFRKGDPVVAEGHLIKYAELGALMSLGTTRVYVDRWPNIAVISSGDELVEPGTQLAGGKIREVNLYSIGALVENLGASATSFPRIPDEYDKLFEVANKAVQISDMVIFTAGSSVSSRDLTAKVINDMGNPGVLVHGLSVKPGKPTILGMSDGKPIIGLPGNPVSAITIFRAVVDPLIRLISGAKEAPLDKVIEAVVDTDLPSSSGRTDFVRVRLRYDQDTVRAVPVHGKSNLISTLLSSDGYVEIDADSSGIYQGTTIEINLD